MSRGLRRAKSMQGGGDREGDIMVVESEVRQIALRYIVLTCQFRSLSMLRV